MIGHRRNEAAKLKTATMKGNDMIVTKKQPVEPERIAIYRDESGVEQKIVIPEGVDARQFIEEKFKVKYLWIRE